MSKVGRRNFVGYAGAFLALLSSRVGRALGLKSDSFTPEPVYTQFFPRTGFETSFVPLAGLPFTVKSMMFEMDEATHQPRLLYEVHSPKQAEGLILNIVQFDQSGRVRGGEIYLDSGFHVAAGQTIKRNIALSDLLSLNEHGPFTRVVVAAISAISEGTRWETALSVQQQLDYLRSGHVMPASIVYSDHVDVNFMRVQQSQSNCDCKPCSQIAREYCGAQGISSVSCVPNANGVCGCSYNCGGGHGGAPPPSNP